MSKYKHVAVSNIDLMAIVLVLLASMCAFHNKQPRVTCRRQTQRATSIIKLCQHPQLTTSQHTDDHSLHPPVCDLPLITTLLVVAPPLKNRTPRTRSPSETPVAAKNT